MKHIYLLLTLFVVSSYAVAESNDAESTASCNSLAEAQNLAPEDRKKYVEQCIADIAEVEKEEAKKEKG